MRKIITPLIMTPFLFLILFSVNATAQDAWHDIPTGITFPENLGKLRYIGKRNYGKPGLGYSLGYVMGKKAVATVYIYHNNESDIGDNKITQPVIKQLARSIQDIYALQKAGLYADVTTYPHKDKIAIQYRKIAGKTFIRTILTHRRLLPPKESKKLLRTYIYMTSKNDLFIKIRYSYDVSEGPEGLKIFNNFMQSLARTL